MAMLAVGALALPNKERNIVGKARVKVRVNERAGADEAWNAVSLDERGEADESWTQANLDERGVN
ncbi:hypothetical protein F5Y13DRAFT_195923 [Hypoxylon sp. FL1857]|nr:hypothetical protein F5Y13DRAFT_195923 [Hypoxylon sp. FL1857]